MFVLFLAHQWKVHFVTVITTSFFFPSCLHVVNYFFLLLISGVAWQLTLSCPKNPKETDKDQIQGKNIKANDGELCILMFRPLIGSDKAVSFYSLLIITRS